MLHLARAICRKTERTLVILHEKSKIEIGLIKFFNRLSDLLFVMARHENQLKNVQEEIWNS
ncbi:hypothetical protein GF376_00610 [Candidatus Peregrinibacteria bacterium]|nr:hypothetical protein [Candidatus Peregrinibacteria bacterium]